jgi:DNA-binding transcriptional MerR regulator
MELSSRIPEKLFFKIGEVCELIKVQPHVLRYWETEFPMLAPQKNRAGQRVYRRKDVEMVLRIRDLLYEEKFTIAGAKKKLMDEMRGGSSRMKAQAREAVLPEPEQIAPDEPVIESEPVHSPAQPAAGIDPVPPVSHEMSPQARRALRVIKRDLEDLLTLLNSDASIKR